MSIPSYCPAADTAGSSQDAAGPRISTFYGRKSLERHEVKVRVIWSDGTAITAHGEQAVRIADGDWDTNWEMHVSRPEAT
jgi:hypothetical protein